MDKSNIVLGLIGVTFFLSLTVLGAVLIINKIIDYDGSAQFYLSLTNPSVIKEYKRSDEIIYFSDDTVGDDLKVGVLGTIYEIEDNMTVYGWCLNYNNTPLKSNATLTIYNRDNSTWLDSTQMDYMSGIGKFYYNAIAPNVTGNYLIEFNCTRESDGAWGVAYSEIEVPQVLQNLKNITANCTGGSCNLTDVNDLLNQLINYSRQINHTTYAIYNYTDDINETVHNLFVLMGADELSWSTNVYGDKVYGNTILFETDVRYYIDIDNVRCNITTTFWGQDKMNLNDYSKTFIYENNLNDTGEFNWSVDCYEN